MRGGYALSTELNALAASSLLTGRPLVGERIEFASGIDLLSRFLTRGVR